MKKILLLLVFLLFAEVNAGLSPAPIYPKGDLDTLIIMASSDTMLVFKRVGDSTYFIVPAGFMVFYTPDGTPVIDFNMSTVFDSTLFDSFLTSLRDEISITGDIVINNEGKVKDGRIYFYNEGSSTYAVLRFDSLSNKFHMNHSLDVAGSIISQTSLLAYDDLYINYDDAVDEDGFLYFHNGNNTARWLMWADASDAFVINDIVYQDSVVDGLQLITKDYADGLSGTGEVNTLGDTGTFNGTDGFGLSGGKTGTVLKVKGLIEGSNITITESGDSSVIIAAGAGAGLDSAEVIQIVNDTGYVHDDGDTVTGTYRIDGEIHIEGGNHIVLNKDSSGLSSFVYWNTATSGQKAFGYQQAFKYFFINDSLNMNSKNIIALADPVNSTDATTKNYVDNTFDSVMQHLEGMAYGKPSGSLYVADDTIRLAIRHVDADKDLVFRLGYRDITLDCFPTKSVTFFEAGTDANNPQINYFYVTDTNSDGAAELRASTSLPTGSFCWLGKGLVPDPTTFGSTGAYMVQRYTESFVNSERGTESHAREKLRALGTVYINGVVPSLTIWNSNPDTMHLAVTAGQVYQLHRQTFPERENGSYLFGNGTHIYEEIGDLSSAIEYQDGSSSSGDYVNLVIWGAVNRDTSECKLFVNVPTSGYNNSSNADADIDNTADYSIPDDMRGVGFLIARIVVYFQNANSITEINTYSLLGQPIGIRSAGATQGAASTIFSDGSFRLYDNGDVTKLLAFEAGSITTGNTRTLTIPDANGTIALQSYVDLIGDDTANYKTAYDSVTAWDNGVLLWADGSVAVTTYLEYTPVGSAAYGEGRVFYDNVAKALSYYNDESEVSLQIGQEQYVRVKNISGATIIDGKVVYLSGASGQLPTIELADANSQTTSFLIGVTTHDIENNTDGYVTVGGIVNGLNTSAFSDGDKVYLSTTAGEYTTTSPTAPDCIVEVGTIAYSNAATGKLFVHPGHGKRLTDLGDILITGRVEGDILLYSVNGSDTIWTDTSFIDLLDAITGDVTFSGGASTVGDNSHAHDGTTISGLDSTDITDNSLSMSGEMHTFTSAELLGRLTDETGTGVAVFGTSPTFTTSINIPNGTAPTVDAEGEIAYETDVDVLLTYDGSNSLAIATARKSKSFVILNITDAEDFVFWQTPHAITLINVSAICAGGTNVIGQLQEYTGGGITPANTMTTDLTITTTETTSSTWSNAAIDAGDWIGWKTTSVSGTVTAFSLTFEYEVR